MSSVEFKKPIYTTDKTSFGEALNGLQNKINNIQKTISYLDAYNITTVVTTPEEMAAAISLLPPGEGLINNVTYPFEENNESYRTGDIVLRLLDNRIIKISTTVGGVYYPSQLVKHENNEYTLTYSYSAATPTIGASNMSIGSPISTPTETINVQLGTLQGNQDSNVYGILQVLENKTFSHAYATMTSGSTTYKIHPVIKFFVKKADNSVGEEVDLRYSFTEDDEKNNWTVTLTEDVQLSLYIEVK